MRLGFLELSFYSSIDSFRILLPMCILSLSLKLRVFAIHYSPLRACFQIPQIGTKKSNITHHDQQQVTWKLRGRRVCGHYHFGLARVDD